MRNPRQAYDKAVQWARPAFAEAVEPSLRRLSSRHVRPMQDYLDALERAWRAYEDALQKEQTPHE